MNHIIRNLSVQNYINFYRSFSESKNIFWDEKNNRLTHSGEFGGFREDLIKKWLSLYIPQSYGISSGFLVSSNGEISTQCDIIVYDKARTPVLENTDCQRFFPIETVCAIGEVKSDIASSAILSGYLRKLALIKKMRLDIVQPDPYYRPNTAIEFNPSLYPYDSIFSFLICKKLGFRLQDTKIDYANTPNYLHHNAVLSLDDGLLAYVTDGNNLLFYPQIGNNISRIGTLPSTSVHDGMPNCVSFFTHNFHMNIREISLLNIDMARYLEDDVLEKLT